MFLAMKQAGLRPSTISYNALISAYGKAGQLDKVMEVFQVGGRVERGGWAGAYVGGWAGGCRL